MLRLLCCLRVLFFFVVSFALRPGRFDQLIHVGLPDAASRVAILKVCLSFRFFCIFVPSNSQRNKNTISQASLRNTPVEDAVSADDFAYLKHLVSGTHTNANANANPNANADDSLAAAAAAAGSSAGTELFSGADMAGICNSARRLAIREHVDGARAAAAAGTDVEATAVMVVNKKHFEAARRGR
jgi:SpoVK/Ycf46/Vps4 family AAA+-type ATPase